ncbi:hypothetical protein TNCV_1423361 [Trichonephila clavipes]|nr:hypothetical protein TNCV_1423361 [Trichonephila clavipes]
MRSGSGPIIYRGGPGNDEGGNCLALITSLHKYIRIWPARKNQTIHRKGRETPDRSENQERPPSTSTESYRSISPLLEKTSRIMIDELKDLNLPYPNDTSRPVKPQDTTSRRRLALTEDIKTTENYSRLHQK